ncbi:MAG: hypothetical protein NC186_02060 [Prevotella sp.]|nr:hypothetical protein [Prevotella sp.]MCM1475072.1 hypothetical protein [Muribaculaceae bacterium]
MVYRFKFVSDEVEKFAREIEIDSEASFFIFRNAILESVGYTKDSLDSFLLCDDNWEGHEEVVIEDMGSSSDVDIWLMDSTSVSELVEDEGQKLRFIFDNLSERSFFMELAEIIPEKHLSAPVCTIKKGTPPKQTLPLEIFNEPVVTKSIEDIDDDDIYVGSQYNEEDLEGFAELEEE